ncbi:MAG: integrin alpha [Myxococcota bacterium]
MILLLACVTTDDASKVPLDPDPPDTAADTADTDETDDTTDTARDSATDTDTTSDTDTGTVPAERRDLDMDDAEPRILGDANLQQAGTSISVGDADGDGETDILLSGQYGVQAWIFPANLAGVHEVGEAAISFSGGDEYACNYPACVTSFVGDVDGDGHDDVLIGRPDEGNGEADLLLGPFSGDRDVATADSVFTTLVDYSYAGTTIGAGDFDADGLSDLLIGAPSDITGRAYVVYGPAVGRDLSEADAVLRGVTTDGDAGTLVQNAGDLDGDGIDDILVGTNYQASTLFVVHGPARGAIDLWDADRMLTLPALDAATVSDLDGDGAREIVLGSGRDEDDPNGSGPGRIWVLPGEGAGTADEDDAVAVLEGETRYHRAGRSLGSAGDADGDGREDLLVGASSGRGSGAAVAYLVLGPVSGAMSLADARVRMVSSAEADAPMELAPAGDIDGDGVDDFLIATPYQTVSARFEGAVWPIVGSAWR